MNYSLLVMESAGMMKMSIGEGSPLRQGAGTGSRLVFWWLQRLCGGGTPDLGFFLEVWGYIGGIGVGKKSGGPRGGHEIGARPGGYGAPTLVVASGLLWSISGTPWVSYDPKTISMKFLVNWTLFGFPFPRYSKTRKNRNWHRALG